MGLLFADKLVVPALVSFATRLFWPVMTSAVVLTAFSVWAGWWLLACISWCVLLVYYLYTRTRWAAYMVYAHSLSEAFASFNSPPATCDSISHAVEAAESIEPPEQLRADHDAVLQSLRTAASMDSTFEVNDPRLEFSRERIRELNRRLGRWE